MPRSVAQTDIRFGFLRLSTIKKCPHMLKSDHMGLRNSKEKYSRWVRWWWYEVITMKGLINLLNLRSEFFSHCRHKSQHFLTKSCCILPIILFTWIQISCILLFCHLLSSILKAVFYGQYSIDSILLSSILRPVF